MKTWEQKLVPGGFALAGVLFLVAAFKPTMTGQDLNATFLLLGIVFLLFGVVFLRRRSGHANRPNP